MIPYSYNMVDMGGLDLAEANGTVVEGLYNRLALARNACGDLILFNWKFAEIEIAPSPCSTLDEGTVIVINGLIQVTEQDEVTVPGINPDPPQVVLVPLDVTENGQYNPFQYEADGFSEVNVNVSTIEPWPTQEVYDYIVVKTNRPMYNGGYEYVGYVYGTQFAQNCGLVLLSDASQGATSVQLTESISNFSGVVLQGVYNKQRTSGYNTTLLYLNPQLNTSYWAGMKDRNSSYTCSVTFTSDTTATLSGNKQVIIYGIP